MKPITALLITFIFISFLGCSKNSNQTSNLSKSKSFAPAKDNLPFKIDPWGNGGFGGTPNTIIILTKTATGYTSGPFNFNGINVVVNFGNTFYYQLYTTGTNAIGSITSVGGGFDPSNTTFESSNIGLYAIYSFRMIIASTCLYYTANTAFNSYTTAWSNAQTAYQIAYTNYQAQYQAWYAGPRIGNPPTPPTVLQVNYINDYLIPALQNQDFCTNYSSIIKGNSPVTIYFKVIVWGYDANGNPIFAMVPPEYISTMTVS